MEQEEIDNFITKIKDNGYACVIFSPEILERNNADAEQLEEILEERADNFLEWSKING